MRHRGGVADDFGAGSLFGDLPEHPVSQLSEHGPLLLFVCTANISRSPFCEMRARQLLGEGTPWRVESAGVPGTRGRTMDPGMVPGAQDRRIPQEWIDAHRSQPVNRLHLAEATLIVAMEKRHRNALLDMDPDLLGRVFTLHQAAEAASALERDGMPIPSLAQLPHLISAHAPVVSGRDDIRDPYAQDAETVAKVTHLLDHDVTALVSLLQLSQ